MRPLLWVYDWVNRAFEGDEAPLLMKAGHYSRWTITAWAAYSIPYDLAGEPWDAWYWHVINGAAGFVFALSLLGMILHSRRMCEPCIAEAPLNPQAQAARWKQALRVSHAPRLTVAVCAVIFLWGFVSPAAVPARWRDMADVAITLFIVAVNWAQWQHSRLQPWCPFCDWGDGGSEEPSPVIPDPVVSA